MMRLQIGDIVIEGANEAEFDYLISKIDALRDKANCKANRPKAESSAPEQAGRFIWTPDMGSRIRRSQEEIMLDLTYDEIIARRKEQGTSTTPELIREEDKGARFDAGEEQGELGEFVPVE